MTTPTPPLLTEAEEREVNKTICDFMGEDYSVSENGNFIAYVPFVDGEPNMALADMLPNFTDSADSLRLVEEQLTPEQWEDYVMLVCIQALTKPTSWSRAVLEGAKCFAKAPVALRARALKEVVKE